MTFQVDKRTLEIQTNRYMTLLSNLASPPNEYISVLAYFKALVANANRAELESLQGDFLAVLPGDIRSLHYIQHGEFPSDII